LGTDVNAYDREETYRIAESIANDVVESVSADIESAVRAEMKIAIDRIKIVMGASVAERVASLSMAFIQAEKPPS
jgi:hypothetical protein